MFARQHRLQNTGRGTDGCARTNTASGKLRWSGGKERGWGSGEGKLGEYNCADNVIEFRKIIHLQLCQTQHITNRTPFAFIMFSIHCVTSLSY